MTSPDPEAIDIIAPGAFKHLPATVPLSFGGIGGPIVGTATVREEEDGLITELRIDGEPADITGLASFSFRIPPGQED